MTDSKKYRARVEHKLAVRDVQVCSHVESEWGVNVMPLTEDTTSSAH